MAEINAAWSILARPGPPRGVGPGERGRGTGVARDGDRKAAPVRNRRRDGDSAACARQGGVTWRRGPAGEGAAGPPPGNPRGSVLPFGRHIGWSIGEIARIDPGYLAWLQPRREGEPFREEIDRHLAALRATPAGPEPAPTRKRGLFR